MGATAITGEALIKEAEKLLAIARKLHLRASDAGSEALEKAYRRKMLYYLEKAVALEKVDPDYIKRLRDKSLEKMHFLERKMELMEKVWHERLYEQYVESLTEYELAYDQAVALGWDPPRDPLPEARHACYKDSGLCRLAQDQPLTACIYNPEFCRWRVEDQTKAVTT
jgi:hypothetical protein